jgi:ribosome biogenesis GTPase
VTAVPDADRRWAGLGWDRTWHDVFTRLPGAPARVSRVDRGRVRVLLRGGDASAAQPLDGTTPVTGDWVACVTDDDQLLIAAVAPRRTALTRRDPADNVPAPQVLAANMDQVWIIHAVDQPLRSGWLDRALVVAHGSGAAPLVVVAKRDLPDVVDVTATVRRLAPDIEVVEASSMDGHGVDGLRRRLDRGRCAALLGRSGAGKSSLINALLGAAALRTGAVRDDAKGRHTTTRRSLVAVGGGTVIDTPGVRALGLWEPAAGLDRTFPRIARLARDCRFADCSHRHEPGCAVLAARDAGRLDADRYSRYITLRDGRLT